MIRRVFRSCCWIVLVLSAGLWVASEQWALHGYMQDVLTSGDDFGLGLQRGVVRVRYEQSPMGFDLSRVLGLPRNEWTILPPSTFPGRTWLPHCYFQFYPGWSPYDIRLVVPAWTCLLVAAGGLMLTRRRRVRPDHCPSCGYDTSRSTLPLCPECGCQIASGTHEPS